MLALNFRERMHVPGGGGGGDTMAVRSTSCASTSHLIYPSIRRQAAALGEAIRSAVAEGRSSSLVYFEAKGSDR